MKAITHEEMCSIELDILVDLDRFCRENNISYYLAYGSLIGAVRHKGFIPWDDDIDVVMPRPDYERFMKMYKNDRFEVISAMNGKAIFPYVKVIDNRTIVHSNYLNEKYDTGVWIDVFPLDGYVGNKEEIFKKAGHYQKLFPLIIGDSSKGTSKKAIIIKKILCPFFNRINIYKFMSKYDKMASEVKLQDADQFIMIPWGYKEREIFPKSMLEDPIEVTFEGHKFITFRDYDKYLTQMYGDYMKLPPEKDRKPHNCKAYWKKHQNKKK